jgi:hypothetical protein
VPNTYHTLAALGTNLQRVVWNDKATLLGLVLISAKFWGKDVLRLLKLVSKPGSSSSVAKDIDSRVSLVVNAATKEGAEEVLSKLLDMQAKPRSQEDLNALLHRTLQLLENQSKPTVVPGRQSSNSPSRDEFNALEEKIDHLTMLYLAQAEPTPSAKHGAMQQGLNGEFLRNDPETGGVSEAPAVHSAQVKRDTGRKRHFGARVKNHKGAPEATLTTEDLSQFAGKSLTEIIDVLKERLRESVVQPLPEYLTDDEKAKAKTSLASLARDWKEQSKKKLHPGDYIEIGTLTDAEAELPRRHVQEFIGIRRKADMVKRLTGEGKKVYECSICKRVLTGTKPHSCIKTNWTVGGRKKGTPEGNKMVISQTGTGNIQISKRTELDTEALNAQLRGLMHLQMLAEERRKTGVNNLSPPPAETMAEHLTPIVELEPEVVDETLLMKDEPEVSHVLTTLVGRLNFREARAALPQR